MTFYVGLTIGIVCGCVLFAIVWEATGKTVKGLDGEEYRGRGS